VPKIEKAIEISDAKIRFVSLVDKAANKKSFLITKAEDGSAQFATYGRIIKADAETHYVTGVVYEPLVEDTDGNFMTEDEIRKAAHWFAKNGDKIDIQHSFEAADGVTVVETYIAPCDMTVGDEPIVKGTWLMTVEITDADIWKAVEDKEITGFSMGGVGKYGKEEIDLEDLTKGAPENTAVDKPAEPEIPTTEPVDVKKEMGFAKNLLSKLGFDFDVVEKGKVAEQYASSQKSSNFWNAWYALEDTLRHYSWSEDKYVFESDESVIREALSEFSEIITEILTEQEVAKSLAAAIPVEKAGKKISTANKKKLDEICSQLTDLCESLTETDEDIEKEDSEMTNEEIKKMIDEGIAEAIAKQNATADNADAEPAAEALTVEGVQKMVDEAVKKAFEAMPTAKLEEGVIEGAEPISEDSIQKMIKDTIEPILKARGVPSNLNDEQKLVEKSDPDVFAGFFA